MKLRDYQQVMADQFDELWKDPSVRNIVGVLPTGGGKTAIMSHVVDQSKGPACLVAHRQELVSQMSLALCRFGVHHGIVASDATLREIVRAQMETFGRSYYDPRSEHRVASVDTLIRRNDKWLDNVGLLVVDECHHLSREGGAKGSVGKWMKAVNLMPRARVLGLTATPMRADGKGLGRHADGIFDRMVEGPNMRWLIDSGFLTDYDIYCPPSDIDLSEVATTSTGDYSPEQLRRAVHKSKKIVGDVVGSYLRFAPGKRGVTFCVDIESATEIAQAYRDAGVPAEVLTGDTPLLQRVHILRRLREGQLLQVTAVDVISEGLDIPAIEVGSFARPTDSYGLFAQQFGRVLRTAEGKDRAIIIDHVGNVMRHRPPDARRIWTLDRREKRAKGAPADVIPMKSCPQCTRPFEKHLVACPFCGHAPEPAGRSTPEQVEGDLQLLDPSVLARLRGEIDAPPKFPHGASLAVVGALKKHHAARTEEQHHLRTSMDQLGGVWAARGYSDREQQKAFFLTFGLDVLSAQALPAREAEALRGKIDEAVKMLALSL